MMDIKVKIEYGAKKINFLRMPPFCTALEGFLFRIYVFSPTLQLTIVPDYLPLRPDLRLYGGCGLGESTQYLIWSDC